MTTDRASLLVAGLLLAAFVAYSFTLYATLPGGGEPLAPAADRGKALWQRYNCTACHQVYGLGGFLGPDLTNIYSNRGEAHIRAMLRTGTNTMPVYPLSDAQLDDLMAYLRHIDGTGKADPRTFKIHPDGTIAQP